MESPSPVEAIGLVELVKRCGTGRDPDSWHELHRRVSSRLEAYVRRRVRSLELAPRADWVRDAVQEVYCRLLERDALAGCRAGSTAQVLAFLRTVCDNTVNDLLRAEGARKRGGSRTIGLDEPHWQLLEERTPDPRQDLERRLADREQVAQVRRLVGAGARGRRSSRNLRIFDLAVLTGWSSREIRERYGRKLTTSAIDSMLYRMRRRIRRDFGMAP